MYSSVHMPSSEPIRLQSLHSNVWNAGIKAILINSHTPPNDTQWSVGGGMAGMSTLITYVNVRTKHCTTNR